MGIIITLLLALSSIVDPTGTNIVKNHTNNDYSVSSTSNIVDPTGTNIVDPTGTN